MRLHSYPSIYAIGHSAVRDLLPGDVIVEEKVDGSQFSFGVHTNPETGDRELLCRSKGADLVLDAPPDMFRLMVETAKRLEPMLHVGWTYRGEALAKPKHNVLCYDRTPVGNVILFDINTDLERYLSPDEKRAEAERLGLECVPEMFRGRVDTAEQVREFLTRTSVLGGQLVEGVVIKPLLYDRFGLDKKVLFAKFVSEAFKEIHEGEWRKANPTRGDVVQQLIDKYKTPARWAKAVQHLREAGRLEGSPRDIGSLLKEVHADLLKEEADAIRDALFKHAWGHISRAVVGGLPEWYKQQLLEAQFTQSKESEEAA